MNNKFLIILVLFLTVSAGCRVKLGGRKSFIGNYEIYIINDSTNQIFIYPLEFKSSNNEKLKIDFTLRTTANKLSNCYGNFSVICKTNKIRVDSICFTTDKMSYTISDQELLFSEKRKNKYESRYTFKCNTLAKDIFYAPSKLKVVLYSENKLDFKPSQQTLKKIHQASSILYNSISNFNGLQN